LFKKEEPGWRKAIRRLIASTKTTNLMGGRAIVNNFSIGKKEK
jgi:hypothetical protein